MNYSNLDLNLIKVFIEIYESKSILGASKKLYVSQPAITNSLKNFEEFLGGKLFIRKSRGVIPTEEGIVLYKSCKELLQNLSNSINNFSKFTELEKGQINIGSSSTIIRRLLLPFLDYFSNKYPKIKITVLDAVSKELEKALKIGEIDIAILNLPIENAEIFNKTIITKTTDCFIAPLNFKKDFLTKEELKNECIILQKKPSSNRDNFEKLCIENNINIIPRYEIGSFGLITDFVEQGMGIAFTIKDFVKLDIEKGRVKEIKTDLDIKPRDVAVLSNKSSVNSFATAKFINEIQKYFKN